MDRLQEEAEERGPQRVRRQAQSQLGQPREEVSQLPSLPVSLSINHASTSSQ